MKTTKETGALYHEQKKRWCEKDGGCSGGVDCCVAGGMWTDGGKKRSRQQQMSRMCRRRDRRRKRPRRRQGSPRRWQEEEQAEESEKDNEPESLEKVTADPEDPGKYRLTGRGTGDFSGSAIRTQALSHQSKYKDCIKQWGIDVSYHNGTIDWEKAKADGVEFAIIRVAYRGYENGKLKVDTQAYNNMKNANAAGVPIGVYIFSQAVSAKEAKQEADFIVKNIKGYKIDLPVVLDLNMWRRE